MRTPRGPISSGNCASHESMVARLSASPRYWTPATTLSRSLVPALATSCALILLCGFETAATASTQRLSECKQSAVECNSDRTSCIDAASGSSSQSQDADMLERIVAMSPASFGGGTLILDSNAAGSQCSRPSLLSRPFGLTRDATNQTAGLMA